jgi:hypothetical protein
VAPSGTAIVLTGEPQAVNTLEEPREIAPKTEPASGLSASFRRMFPPYSFTIMRIQTVD